MADEEDVYTDGGGYEGAGYADGTGGYGDTYTEETHEGYFSKLGNSFAGVCVGIALFIGAFPLLWWNEGRAVDMYQAINEGRKIVVEIDSSLIVDSMNDGKLVHLTGLAEPTTNLTDIDFGIGVTDKTTLSREVEMYQWVETVSTKKKDKLGGGTTTVKTYSYSKQWKSTLVDHTRFSQSNGKYVNPTSMYYTGEKFYADVVLGEFSLPQDMVEIMSSNTGSDSLGVVFNTSMIPDTNFLKQTKNETKVYQQGFYFGTLNTPKIGDTRVSYDSTSEGTVSIIAKQSGSTFEPYKAESGAELYKISMGSKSPEEMFQTAEEDNKTLAWILRFVGALIMILGISAILNPLAIAADIIPCIGDCVGCAVGLVATVVGLFLSLLVIGIAWVANRPIILGVAGAGCAVVGFFVYRGYQKKGQRSRGLDMPPEKNDLSLEERE